MTLKEEIAAIQVELALTNFTGCYDNELTQMREWWLDGHIGAHEERGKGHAEIVRWADPNPDPTFDPNSVAMTIASFNEKRKADTKAELD